jgi:hypothetical protein
MSGCVMPASSSSLIQHCVAKAPLLVELGIFVFQINGFRLLELVIEEVRMGEVAFNKY